MTLPNNTEDQLDEILKIATGCSKDPKHESYQFCEFCEVNSPKAKQKIKQLLVNELEKQRKSINSALTQGIVGVADDIVIIHATKDLIETLLGELALDTRLANLKKNSGVSDNG